MSRSHNRDDKMSEGWARVVPTGCLALADGTVLFGEGVGATGTAGGEICFNTAMTGYQEILTDPSYAGQILTFTFPHIGNVGANEEDLEAVSTAPEAGAVGCVLRARISAPANYRARHPFSAWLERRGIVGIAGIDTRALTSRIRSLGMQNAVVAHDPDGNFDVEALKRQAASLPSMEGRDLASGISVWQAVPWTETPWQWNAGYGASEAADTHIIALDYGIKRNILRLFAGRGARVTVMPANASYDDIMAREPDGVFLSNGPGDPAATGEVVLPTLRGLLDNGVPTFGICLGHQLMGLALGGRTVKMSHGHHGANHPVMDFTTGKGEITSMNHGFAVDATTLPPEAEETHRSLFDGSNCGLRLTDRPAFSVQYHPEASPGPQDSHYLFDRFMGLIREARA